MLTLFNTLIGNLFKQKTRNSEIIDSDAMIIKCYCYTGLATLNVSPKDLSNNKLVAPIFLSSSSITPKKVNEKQKLAINAWSFTVLYNAITFQDFPSDDELFSIIDGLGQVLIKNSDTPWVKALVYCGNEALTTNSYIERCNDADKLALKLSRQKYDDAILPFLKKLEHWIINNFKEIKQWIQKDTDK